MLSSVPFVDQVWDSFDGWLKGVLIVAVSLVLLAKSAKYVNQDELGLRHLRGRVRRNAQPIKPGWAFHVPFVGGVLKRSALPQTWQLNVAVPREERTWDTHWSITFKINPDLLYLSWYGHQDPDEYLRTVCTSLLWHTLKTADVTPAELDHAEVERRVLEPAGPALELIGVTLLELRHRWTAETTASQLGSAIRSAAPNSGVQVASIAALNGNGNGNGHVLEEAAP
ncbi:MAG TPA: SPFH domain-containing protein [Actinophytocola sp.]|uniref:SPFH domain-containing protein n=1 Tax=Actinophytocola sp. TaxID=1872138 RepID=UPI002DBF513F|nr:SPFH domain-containing protein [Actinophytocola sp.]HEU5475195.1 SPFH domain-containing protein [Actinophytocola sp.]